jgi:hypothetical protein
LKDAVPHIENATRAIPNPENDPHIEAVEAQTFRAIAGLSISTINDRLREVRNEPTISP